jgi:hypothetical protein
VCGMCCDSGVDRTGECMSVVVTLQIYLVCRRGTCFERHSGYVLYRLLSHVIFLSQYKGQYAYVEEISI